MIIRNMILACISKMLPIGSNKCSPIPALWSIVWLESPGLSVLSLPTSSSIRVWVIKMLMVWSKLGGESSIPTMDLLRSWRSMRGSKGEGRGLLKWSITLSQLPLIDTHRLWTDTSSQQKISVRGREFHLLSWDIQRQNLMWSSLDSIKASSWTRSQANMTTLIQGDNLPMVLLTKEHKMKIQKKRK